MALKERYLQDAVAEDLAESMVFIGGPRQVGKTTLARDIIGSRFKINYYNWDKIEHRVKALRGEWEPDADLIVLDEYHKHRKWKSWIKGEYDVSQGKYKFLLTGSARLNIYRKGGDSLQGRYHYYTLYPFTFSEIEGTLPQVKPGEELIFPEKIQKENLEILYRFGGFPAPLNKQAPRFHRRWHNERMERFFKEDIRELTMIKDIGTLTLLASLLPEKVASILSINSVANDLQVNFRTAADWLDVFDNFYYTFRLSPYQTKRIASVRKEKKVYLWDWPLVSERGPRVENIVALHLLKFCSYLYEYGGWKVSLMFLRDSTGREVDFLVTFDERPWFAVEVKTKDTKLSGGLVYFREKLEIPYCYQVVYDSDEDFIKSGIRVMPVSRFLAALP
ncbi:MAG: ATP-binding protein [bacterium]|nr:ATP-binding protein [bacterium]